MGLLYTVHTYLYINNQGGFLSTLLHQVTLNLIIIHACIGFPHCTWWVHDHIYEAKVTWQLKSFPVAIFVVSSVSLAIGFDTLKLTLFVDYLSKHRHTATCETMMKQSSSPRPKAQPCKAAQPRTLVKHSEETLPMRLEEAAGYFSSRLPKVFRVVEEVDSPKGSEGVQLAKGE